MSAGNDLSIVSGESRTQMDEHTKASGTSGIASKTTRETHTTIDARTAVGSSLSGDSVQMLAGHDLLVKGSDVVGTQDVRLAAGNNLTVTTAAEQRDESRMIQETKSGLSGTGDINVQGSQLQAGNDALLNASRDIYLTSSQDTERSRGTNSSSGGSVGVGIGAGSGGWGINVSASINKGSGHENSDSLAHNETQVSGESIKADVGRNLALTSEQDSATYDAQQKNTSAGASFNFGSMSGSASINMSKDKMHSDYQSVQEQTGLLAGKGGFDITVGEHTQLNGAVIGSTADEALNRIDTGTLGFSDIHNSAAFKTGHQSVGISTGGSIGNQFAGNMANGLLTGVNGSGSADSTTKAAVSDGTIVIRDQHAQKQDVADLSRDVENANPGLGQIFDKEKEQNRLK